MNKTSNINDPVGVVVGRFQVAELNAGHLHLIREVARLHTALFIAIGCRAGQPTKRDPLDFELRRLMVAKMFPKAIIRPIFDHTSNEAWCKRLDELVQKEFPGRQAVLYGSRDSFVKAYVGKFKTSFVKNIHNISGTSLRSDLARTPKNSKLFREGAIYVTERRHPVTYPTVDVAILRNNKVLLGGKFIDGGKLRFIGGFVDVKDKSLEEAACREANEEVKNVIIGNFLFMGSSKINDYRYRGSGDGIMTSFFKAQFYDGDPQPGDDIDWLEWVKIKKVKEKLILTHQPLGEILLRDMRLGETVIRNAIMEGCGESVA